MVEGLLRNDYEDAFTKVRGPEVLADLMTPVEELIENRIREYASDEVIKQLGKFDDAEVLAVKVAVTRQEIEDKQKQLAQLDRADTREQQRQQINILQKALEESREKLVVAESKQKERKVIYLWTPEIREKLWEAIESANERLLILSGWISSEVLNEAMSEELRKALHRGVRIWIGYGLGAQSRRGKEQREQQKWKQAEATLSMLKREFPDLIVFRDIGRNHEKRLICDNRFTFGGSFNLLSFSGEARGYGPLRHEGADLIENSDFCEELWDRYLNMFFSPPANS